MGQRMPVSPVTRASLLVRIQDPNDVAAWREFFDLYAAVVYGFARKRGLQDADAADLMQEVLRSVANHAGRLNYDRAKGTFRGWLYSVTGATRFSTFWINAGIKFKALVIPLPIIGWKNTPTSLSMKRPGTGSTAQNFCLGGSARSGWEGFGEGAWQAFWLTARGRLPCRDRRATQNVAWRGLRCQEPGDCPAT